MIKILSDLSESGSIEQDADVVMFIYRESYYLQRNDQLGTDETQESYQKKHDSWKDRNEEVFNKAELIVAKQRNGPLVRLIYTLMTNIPNSWELKKCNKLKSQMKLIENIEIFK